MRSPSLVFESKPTGRGHRAANVLNISIVIPTYRREQTLVNTINFLLGLDTLADEILVVDQTQQHETRTESLLSDLHQAHKIRWIRRTEASITKAMNHGLAEARNQLVLFLDDDIEPISELVAEHLHAHQRTPDLWASVGQVVQPWQSPADISPPGRMTGLRKDCDFPFHTTSNHNVENVMAGNLCVNREKTLSIGGFDENFVGSAFRFETEFAKRVGKAGGRIRFQGAAGIKHLRVNEGGTRSTGSHLTSADPKHGVGDHYYAFLHGTPTEAWRYSIIRVLREVRTKFHLTHPWWIPVKLVGETRAMWQGCKLARAKRRETRREQLEKE